MRPLQAFWAKMRRIICQYHLPAQEKWTGTSNGTVASFGEEYVYWWADGVYSKVKMDDKLCLLVIIGTTDKGVKELVAVEDYRESKRAGTSRTGLRARGHGEGTEACRG
ncbi:hypothetical protein MASR2M79_21940 [Aminivibrio sp.]